MGMPFWVSNTNHNESALTSTVPEDEVMVKQRTACERLRPGHHVPVVMVSPRAGRPSISICQAATSQL